MNRAFDTRLARLERAIGGSEDETDDELTIRLWDLARAIGADPNTPPDVRDECKRWATKIEADIIAQAAQLSDPRYAGHLEWVRSMWRSRTGKDDYVPALTGHENGMGEYQDWDAPRIMQRRSALRSRPDIQRLIRAAGAQAGQLQ